MSKYIKREDALDAVLFALAGTGHQSKAIYAIKDAPTADVVEVRHGHWISEEEAAQLDRYDLAYTCSVCGRCDWDCTESKNFNFCPNCGAKMDGERREENGI